MSDFTTLSLEHGDDGVTYVTLQRPDKLNALNETVLGELQEVAETLQTREGLRVVVIRGEGRAFVAGADIASMVEMSPEEGAAFVQQGHDTMDAIETIPVPTIAAVDGFALGGGLELAVACDLIYASGRASFGVPEVKLGIIPGFGGTQRLAGFVGWHHARQMVFTGRTVDAQRAHEIGLALEIFTVDDFDERVREVAETIAARGPVAVRTAKNVMRGGQDLPLDEGLALERDAFEDLFGTDDRREGMEAFIESREPNFDGR